MSAGDQHANFTRGKVLDSHASVVGGILGAVAELVEAAMDGLEAAGHDVMDVAQTRVPVLAPAEATADRPSGELRDTAQVQAYPKSKRVALRYGTEYAAYQHERMDLKHPTGGQAKYLESAMLDGAETTLATVAEHMRAVTDG